MEKVLLDTDIGSDIDDAICLSYLLLNHKCELCGVTTVTGEVDKRSMIADYLIEKAKKKIPVFPGCEIPLIGEQKQKNCPQFEYLEKINYRKSYDKFEWLNFLRKTIRENPNKINLITIGPLTNIGILFKFDPEIPSLLKALILWVECFLKIEKLNGILGVTLILPI